MKINWDDFKEYEVVDGLFGKFLHGEKSTIVRWRFVEGAELPAHSHIHEQLTIMVEGSLTLSVGEDKITLKPGEFVQIPSDIVHSGISHTETFAIDVFSPARADFRENFP